MHVKEKQFGIKEFCIWNNLNNFHIYENYALDIMHDLYEGVYRYDMALIINELINNNFITLEILNERIKYFTYDDFENIPPPVKLDHLKKRCIVFSASEMHCFVKNFRFLIGDLIPDSEKFNI